MKKYVVLDVEGDGPVPGLFSMVCFGAVIYSDKLDKTFYGKTKPIVDNFKESSLAISGFTREEHEGFDDPETVIRNFANWLIENGITEPVLISDNPGFDAAWMNYYFHRYLGYNPFGSTSRRIGDLFCGMEKDMRFDWKQYRKTIHDHNPVNDAIGNAEALLVLEKKYGMINLK